MGLDYGDLQWNVMVIPLFKKHKESPGLRYVKVSCGEDKWRRERDSNPRYVCTYNGFRDRHIQPLCHLSAEASSLMRCVVQRNQAPSLRLDFSRSR